MARTTTKTRTSRMGRKAPADHKAPAAPVVTIVTDEKPDLPKGKGKPNLAKVTTKAGTPKKVTPKANTPRETAVAKVARLIKDAKTDEDRRAAVDAAIGLKRADMTDALKGYIREHGHLIHSTAAAAVETFTDRETGVKTLEEKLKLAKEASRAAAKLVKDRSAAEVRFVYAVLDVHKVYSRARDLSEAWGVGEAYISNCRAMGKQAAQLGATSDTDINFIKRARKDESPALTAALKVPGATMASVREAITVARTERKQANAPTPPEPDPLAVDVDAHEVLTRAAAILVLLNQDKMSVADVGDVTGDFVIRQLRTALAAYDKRMAQTKTTAVATVKSIAATDAEVAAAG